MVGDLGVEPSLPEGTQIYSLLQSPVLLITQCLSAKLQSRPSVTTELAVSNDEYLVAAQGLKPRTPAPLVGSALSLS